MEVVAQVLSVIGMAFNIVSFQQKSQKGVIICQFFGSILFSLSYFFLGAFIGALLNAIVLVRTIVFYLKDKTHATSPVWFVLFILSYCVCYLLVFTVFAKPVTPQNLIIEVLPVVGLVAHSYAYMKDTSAMYRKMSFICSPCWLVYNIVNFSIGGIICEIISIASIIVGLFRHDIKKQPSSDE